MGVETRAKWALNSTPQVHKKYTPLAEDLVLLHSQLFNQQMIISSFAQSTPLTGIM